MINIHEKLAILLALLCAAAFAQGEQKIAVYATGSLGANEKEALNTKMLSSLSSSGKYKAIDSPEAFFSGLQEYEKGNALENSQIVAFGKQLGVQRVCIINIKPAFDSYHVSARIIDTETSEVAVMGETSSALKSFEDLANATNELSAQLLPLQPAAQAATPAAVLAPTAAPMQCDKKYNVNEIAAQIQHGFPAQLKDCGSSFVKDMALSKVPFSKTPPPEPKSYMTKCAIDGVKGRLPEGFPGADKVADDLQNFVNGILNVAMAGASLDPVKLASAIGDMKTDDLLGGIKNMAAENPSCFVDEPYEYVEPVKEDKAEEGGKKKFFTLGIRAGMNFSHLYAEGGFHRQVFDDASGTYGSTLGFNIGLVFDFALSNVFHLQPGIMYVQKGAHDSRYSGKTVTFHYAEIPALLSLKFSDFRLNAGAYLGLGDSNWDGSTGNGYRYWPDFGISTGFGFDIGTFYIGMFYDYGLDISYYQIYPDSYRRIDGYNRTLGFNFGVNL